MSPLYALMNHSAPDENGCWLWLSGDDGDGYGVARIDGRHLRMHRWFYEQHVGPIPEGMQALHRCDVRRCVNPGHLFLGSNTDNMADKATKGRAANRDTGNGNAKLTSEQVAHVIATHRPGRNSPTNSKHLARTLGVSARLIRAIAGAHRNGENP